MEIHHATMPHKIRAVSLANAGLITARIVLGLIFTLGGLSGFLLIGHPLPVPAGLAGEFQRVFFQSGWVYLVDGAELIAGVLLLANRFVPLALALLAAVLPNILTFHITMMPGGIGPGLFATLLWLVLARQHRSILAPFFRAKFVP